MHIKKLDHSFYPDHTHLKEVLDLREDGRWIKGKDRGYGIAVVTIDNLKFAIPLRSTIKHNAAYITVKSHLEDVHGKGLDYTKAILISDNKYISDENFLVPAEEHKILQSKARHIVVKFEKYVEKYKKAVQKQ
ncbi:MAG TPA: hypothetical protein DCR51_12745, partial [Idiomarina loihiensis]|nr:hypothetical protein [Idiomarina loihiensis]